MKLRVGQSVLRGDVAKYAARFDFLELRAEPGRLAKPARLRQWAKAVPSEFVFSVRLPRAVSDLRPSDEAEQALAFALKAADALGAGWIVLQSSSSVGPSARSRRRIAELVERVRGDGRRVAWEPRSVWEEADEEAFAAELGVHLVRDLSRRPAPAGDVLYTRLLALGDGARIGEGAVEELAARLEGRAEAWVVVEGQGAGRASGLLRQLLTDAA